MKRAVVLCLFAATAALAEAPRSKLFAPDPWWAGETTTETGTFRQTLRPVVPVGSIDARSKIVATEYRLVRRCVAVDASGRWTRGEAAIEKWSRSAGDVVDRSIEGARVSLEADGTWKIVSGGAEPSAEARRWLDSTFSAKNAMGGEDSGAPPEDAPQGELEVGTPATVRLKSMESGYAKLGLPVPAEGVNAKYLLTSVEPSPDGAKIAFVQTIDASFVGAGRWGDKDAKYLEGTEVHQRADCTKTLGRAHSTYSLRVENEFTVVVETTKGPAKNTTSIVSTLERVPGGTMPGDK